jgi:hypothetical protein
MIPGAVHRFPGFCLTAEETSGKLQLGDRMMELCLKWGPFSINEVGRIAQHVRKGEGFKTHVQETYLNLTLWDISALQHGELLSCDA